MCNRNTRQRRKKKKSKYLRKKDREFPQINARYQTTAPGNSEKTK